MVPEGHFFLRLSLILVAAFFKNHNINMRSVTNSAVSKDLVKLVYSSKKMEFLSSTLFRPLHVCSVLRCWAGVCHGCSSEYYISFGTLFLSVPQGTWKTHRIMSEGTKSFSFPKMKANLFCNHSKALRTAHMRKCITTTVKE